MANIVLKTYAAGDDGQGTVTPQDDALIYQNAVPMNGLFSGGTVTLTESNVLHIASGFGIIGGRFFEINDSDISVELSSAGTLLGRVYVHLELTNADVPISIAVATGATLPALEGDANLNITNGNFDLELATFNVSEVTISDIVNTFPTIRKANNQLRRATAYSLGAMVFCQSASDNLVFVCTTAGTTAVQQPMGYATITDGNTITDGTAVFKAVDLMGAIDEVNTKISKTEDLISNSDDAYKPTQPYSVGNYVIHDDKLYRCTTACSAGSWATNQSCFIRDTLVNVSNKLNGYENIEITKNTTSALINQNQTELHRIGNLCILDLKVDFASIPTGSVIIGAINSRKPNTYILQPHSRGSTFELAPNGNITVGKPNYAGWCYGQLVYYINE